MDAIIAAALEREKTEVDPRVATIKKNIVTSDMTDEEQKVVLRVVVSAYEKFVLGPTKSSWRKDTNDDPAWSRKMLEREVERTTMIEMCKAIKKDLDAELGCLWHVVYGRAYAAQVSFENGGFIHFQMDGADVMAWRHGK